MISAFSVGASAKQALRGRENIFLAHIPFSVPSCTGTMRFGYSHPLDGTITLMRIIRPPPVRGVSFEWQPYHSTAHRTVNIRVMWTHDSSEHEQEDRKISLPGPISDMI